MTKRILLTQGQFALVDDDMFEYLNQWKWYCSSQGRAVRNQNVGVLRRITILMHRVVAQASDEMDVDHVNGNPLDNRRENLRVCTHAQNMANSKRYIVNKSGYRGVGWHKKDQKWFAQIRVNQTPIHLGSFDDPIEAAKAYDNAAKKYFGEFARLNFPE